MTLVKQKSTVVEATKSITTQKAIVLMVVVEMNPILLKYMKERCVCRLIKGQWTQEMFFLGLGNVQLVVLSHSQQLGTCEETTI
jgi:hypothetical protein